jgi:chromate transporter
LALDLPILSSVNVASGLLSLAAAVAIFQLKLGIIQLLVACSGSASSSIC